MQLGLTGESPFSSSLRNKMFYIIPLSPHHTHHPLITPTIPSPYSLIPLTVSTISSPHPPSLHHTHHPFTTPTIPSPYSPNPLTVSTISLPHPPTPSPHPPSPHHTHHPLTNPHLKRCKSLVSKALISRSGPVKRSS